MQSRDRRGRGAHPRSRRRLAVAWAASLGAFGLACWDANAPSAGTMPVPLAPMHLDTYDGSGQVVHPDVVPRVTSVGPMWLGITPYPFGNATYENPSVFRSRDGLTWKVPDGLINPVTSPTVGHLSDPDLVQDPTSRELRLYFRQVAGGRNIALLTRSNDGEEWTEPVAVADAPSHELVSPSVVVGAPGAAWQMWSVNAGGSGCAARTTTIERRLSSDGVTWGPPQPVDLAHPESVIWHIDVQWIPDRAEYWALYNVYAPTGTCVTPQLHLATSADGLHWTPYVTPVLARGALPSFSDIVYRSTFAYDPDAGLVWLWYSGAAYRSGRYVWAAAVEARLLDGFLASLTELQQIGDVAPPLPDRPLPPPEPGDMPVE